MIMYRRLFLVFFVIVGATSGQQQQQQQERVRTSGSGIRTALRTRFQKWMTEFGKEYESAQEQWKRFAIWMDNHKFIARHNNDNNNKKGLLGKSKATFTLGHNQFSDMTFEEYKAYNKLGEYSPGVVAWRHKKKKNHVEKQQESSFDYLEQHTEAQRRRSLKKLPKEVNWVEKGAIPPVKNQGMCGSCWAFSAVGAIESKRFLDTGDLIPLSEQQLIDCDRLDLGCSGGLMDNAFLFAENSTGLCSDAEYPYVMHKRWFRGCASDKGLCTPVPHSRVESFVDVPNTALDLVHALAQQPVSVAIQADTRSFQFYKSGVYQDEACGDDLDHGVLAVGYGTENGTDYFWVRNSWGAEWGLDGYIKMARASPHVNGTCGILAAASRPILRDNE